MQNKFINVVLKKSFKMSSTQARAVKEAFIVISSDLPFKKGHARQGVVQSLRVRRVSVKRPNVY